MGVGRILKKIIGNKGITRLKVARGIYRYAICRAKEPEKFTECDSQWQLSKVYQEPRKHVFFGYYDIQQFNTAHDKLLLTKVTKDADTKRDKAELVWIDIQTDTEHLISSTSAWCWQQGARLRWHPVFENTVLFNDVKDGHYITRVWDLLNNEQIREYPRALYDITPDMRWGFSLNYSRLQRLRPGYGYNTIPDETEQIKAPKNDGLFLVNLDTGESKLLVSLFDLSDKTPESIELWNYINHISVSPSGKRLIFFHIWTPDTTARWMVSLYSINVDGSDLKCLEHEYRTSHYCWIDDDHILTTAGGFPKHESRYMTYDIVTGNRTILEGDMFAFDGHPTILKDKDWFVTDTYPLQNCRQILYRGNIKTGEYQPILNIFSDPRMYDEKRCDLHPRVTPDGNVISIDSTAQDGRRAVYILKKTKGE